jgi:hypothetical protein
MYTVDGIISPSDTQSELVRVERESREFLENLGHEQNYPAGLYKSQEEI